MSKLIAIMAMSLDGYVTDKQDGVDQVLDWFFSGKKNFSWQFTMLFFVGLIALAWVVMRLLNIRKLETQITELDEQTYEHGVYWMS